ncbi:uncharacterized protein LOC144828385 [Lissotriton helveticus]
MRCYSLGLLVGLLVSLVGAAAGQTEEYSSTTPHNNVTGDFPGYYNHTTTGRCGAGPLLCCPARNDSCRRTDCYCDEYCNRPSPDCCQDYFNACHGGQIVPYYSGAGPSTVDPFTGSTVVPTPDTALVDPDPSTASTTETTETPSETSDWTMPDTALVDPDPSTASTTETTEIPSETSDWTMPDTALVDPDPSTASTTETTEIPSETSDWTMPEYSSPTVYNNVTGSFPGYPNYTTTGRCGTEPLLCCPARDDSCRRTNCYCDEYCNRPTPDCCQDYFDACHGGQIVPYYSGTGPPTVDTFTGSTVVPTPGSTSATPGSSTVQPTTGSTTFSSDWTTDQSTSEDCIPTEPGRKFPTMCSGQRKNVIRHCDLYGCGNYGGPRGRRYLKGVDIVCRDGLTVYAPFNGTIQSGDLCYGDVNDKPSDDGFTFIGSGLCVRIFNVKLDEHSGWIQKGCRLGTLMPMRTQYPRITSHIHIQKCDLSDPTGLISEVETHHHSCTDPDP